MSAKTERAQALRQLVRDALDMVDGVKGWHTLYFRDVTPDDMRTIYDELDVAGRTDDISVHSLPASENPSGSREVVFVRVGCVPASLAAMTGR